MATSIGLALPAPDREQVVCHLVEARMDYLVVYGSGRRPIGFGFPAIEH